MLVTQDIAASSHNYSQCKNTRYLMYCCLSFRVSKFLVKKIINTLPSVKEKNVSPCIPYCICEPAYYLCSCHSLPTQSHVGVGVA